MMKLGLALSTAGLLLASLLACRRPCQAPPVGAGSGAIEASITVRCGKKKYALTTGNDDGQCRRFKDDQGNTTGGACTDNKGNGSSATCAGNGGDGDCAGSTGSGDCRQLEVPDEPSDPSAPNPGAVTQ